MPSPDFSQYIDLTIDDRDAADVYDDAVEYARIALPEFTPRVGTIEDSVLQACALMASLNIGTLNRLPHGLMEGILKIMGFTRYEATYSTVSVEFTLSGPGLTVPNDFYVVYDAVIGDETVQYPFRTTSQVTAGSLDTEVSTTLTCLVPGVIPTLLSGTELVIVQPNSSILSCVTTSLITQGVDPETDEEYFARATSYLSSLSTSLVTANQIQEFVMSSFPDVHRCKVYDLRKAIVDTGGSIAVASPTSTGTSTSAFNSASTFTDYTRIINTATTTAGQSSVESGLYDTTDASSTTFTFTAEGDKLTTPVDATFIDMVGLSHDLVPDDAGYFIIFVCDEDGAALSSSLKTAIHTAVSERIVAGLSFVVLDALICDMQFTVNISIDPEYSAASIASTVAAELESYISPENWPNWENMVRVFDVVVRANSIEGVSYVNSVLPAIPEYGDTPTAMEGNELAIDAITSGTTTTALKMKYVGSLPRASIEVTVS